MSRYVPRLRPRKDFLNEWLTFLRTHWGLIGAMDFFTVPAATCRVLYVWFLDVLGIYHPQLIEFARLNLNYSVMS